MTYQTGLSLPLLRHPPGYAYFWIGLGFRMAAPTINSSFVSLCKFFSWDRLTEMLIQFCGNFTSVFHDVWPLSVPCLWALTCDFLFADAGCPWVLYAMTVVETGVTEALNRVAGFVTEAPAIQTVTLWPLRSSWFPHCSEISNINVLSVVPHSTPDLSSYTYTVMHCLMT